MLRYVQRLCEEVEQRQASAHDDGATLHDIIKSFDAFEVNLATSPAAHVWTPRLTCNPGCVWQTNTSEGTLRTFLKVFKHHHSVRRHFIPCASRLILTLGSRLRAETGRAQHKAVQEISVADVDARPGRAAELFQRAVLAPA